METVWFGRGSGNCIGVTPKGVGPHLHTIQIGNDKTKEHLNSVVFYEFEIEALANYLLAMLEK
jgi:hypothetical protein